MAVIRTLTLQLGAGGKLKRRVAALAENRPAVYRMLDPTGRVIYVGKAKRLRSRLLSYFRAQYPDDKAARILQATDDLAWDYVPSEFAALLGEMRQIHRYRPPFNVRMNRARRAVFIKVAGGPAPKLYVGRNPAGEDVRHYGPFLGAGHLHEAIKALNDLLGLRDCSLRMPIVYRDQGDLFDGAAQAGCLRYEIGTCSGPCGGLVTEIEYRRRIQEALDFVEGRALAPLDRVIEAMTDASEDRDFERASWWRDRFDTLTWLLEACGRMQAALDSLTFVYVDPGSSGDDRAYVIRRAQVCAAAPAPRTPIETEAFCALVREHADVTPEPGPIPHQAIDETLLILSWFRRHPGALQRTVPLETWLARHDVRDTH
ncbi:MAG: nuclease [Gemmatimonadales bacterium]|nr:nuclease [Gemmatimonadales bacterium]